MLYAVERKLSTNSGTVACVMSPRHTKKAQTWKNIDKGERSFERVSKLSGV